MKKLIFITFLLTSCTMLKVTEDAFKSYPQDNFAEEILEELIEVKTGVDLDLSPFTPEKK